MPLVLQEIDINITTHDSIWEIWQKCNYNFQEIEDWINSISSEVTVFDGGPL